MAPAEATSSSVGGAADAGSTASAPAPPQNPKLALADQLWARGVRDFLEGRSAGKQTEGLRAFEASVKADPSRTERHFFVATLRFLQRRAQEAEESYEAAIASAPESGDAYLELVLYLESANRRDEARKVALRAIRAGARWGDEWQRPPIFINGLASRPWWDGKAFSWTGDLEKAYPIIKDEMQALLKAKGSKKGTSMPKEWVKVGEERASHDAEIVDGGEWREFIIFGAEEEGAPRRDPDVNKHLTKTCSLLQELIPGAVSMAKLGAGEIIFSALAPGTRLVPHCASSNVRLTCHLGMVCPPGAKIRVGPTWGGWEEGKCMFFDDSFEHEIVHAGNSMRIVLLIRFWHPDLKEDMRLPALQEGMEQYNKMDERRSSPPLSAAVVELLSAQQPHQTQMATSATAAPRSAVPAAIATGGARLIRGEAADLVLAAPDASQAALPADPDAHTKVGDMDDLC